MLKESRIKMEFGPITVDEVKASQFNEQKQQAQLRQIVKKIYPSANVADSLTDPLFNQEEFNFSSEGRVFEEARVTWVDVPNGKTAEDVLAKLKDSPLARLVKHIGLNPILTDEQAMAIQNGLNGITIESIAAKQVVKDEEENIRPYKGYLQYRVVKLSTKGKEDIDTREEDFKKFEAAGAKKPFEMANPTTVIAKVAEAQAQGAE